MISIFILSLLVATPILGGPLGLLAPRTTFQENTNGWRDVMCDYGSLPNAIRSDPWDLWNDAKASEAWMDLQMEYGNNKTLEPHIYENTSFTTFMGDYFHARVGLECGQLENANCEVSVVCGQKGNNAEVSAPAGYIIINSIIQLHRNYQSLADGISKAYNDMLSEIGTYTSIFAPQPSQMTKNKVMMDIIMMGFGVVSAGLFNSWLKELPYFKRPTAKPNQTPADLKNERANRLGEMKDTTNLLVSQGITIYKDSMSTIDQLKVQNDMSKYLGDVVWAWSSMINQTLWRVMEEDPRSLHNIISNGAMWNVGNGRMNPMQVTADVQKALYAYMTPTAWKSAGEEIGAFIATSEGIEGSEDDCESWDPLKKYEQVYTMPGGIISSNRFCDSPDGKGKAYWLLGMKRSNKQIGDCTNPAAPGVTACDLPEIKQLPGWDTLDGTQWGGLTGRELVNSAVLAWKNNNGKNGWTSTNVETSEGRDAISENGINAMGMVNIPVCSFSEAFGNAYPDKKSDNWPCN